MVRRPRSLNKTYEQLETTIHPPILAESGDKMMSRQCSTFNISDIIIGDRIRKTINEDAILSLMESIKDGGLHEVPTVREVGDAVHLVTGRHRLIACRKLGWTEIDCRLFRGSETEARMWEIDENLRRSELTALEKAEHLDEYRKLVLLKRDASARGNAQLAHSNRGGKPDRGHSQTAKEHGVVRREVQRAEAIAAIAPEAKAAACDAGLDDNQSALPGGSEGTDP
jgi:hypothetical protein